MITTKMLKKLIQVGQLKAFLEEQQRRAGTCLESLPITPLCVEFGRLELPHRDDLTPAARWYAEWRSHRLGGFSTIQTELIARLPKDDMGKSTSQQRLEWQRQIDWEGVEPTVAETLAAVS